MSHAIERERQPGASPETNVSESGGIAALPKSAASPWILNRWHDLLLFIATPLLIVPLVALAQWRFTIEQISLFVIAFGAGGHHLPGMMRAYGDRALFRQFKTRFIVAPIFLLVFCVAFAQWDLNGLFVLLLAWGFWHGLMQVYGFVRIYDAKVGSFGKLTSRLDWLLCVAWFSLGLVMSPSRMGDLLDTFYRAGGPLIPVETVRTTQYVWMALTAVVTAAFLANDVWLRVRRRPANPVKLLIMSTSFAFWWYTQVHIANILLGIALFEIFHDVQYLSIVWIFNRKRAASDPRSGAFTRMLFRPSSVMMAVYVALCFLYGGAFLLGNVVDVRTSRAALFGFGTASTFLHFYYDGFIWKVREKSTRRGLGLAGGATAAETFPGWMTHGAKWAIFVLPACMLWFAEVYGRAPVVDRYQNVAAAVPNWAVNHHRLGLAYKDGKNDAAAIDSFRRAVELDPNFSDAHLQLGETLHASGDKQTSTVHYEKAIDTNPRAANPHLRYGLALYADRKPVEAEEHFRRALELDAKSAEAHFSLATVLQSQGHTDEAIEHLQAATRFKPDFTEAHLALGSLLQKKPAAVGSVP